MLLWAVMAPERRFVLVGDDGTFRVVVAETDTLETLQRLVDGLVELVTVPLAPAAAATRAARSLDIWVNEEGIRRSDFCVNDHVVAMAQIRGLGPLVGPAVLTVSADGDTQGLSGPLIAALRAALLRTGATEMLPTSAREAAEQQRASRAQRKELGYAGHGLHAHVGLVGLDLSGTPGQGAAPVVGLCGLTVAGAGQPCRLQHGHLGGCRSR